MKWRTFARVDDNGLVHLDQYGDHFGGLDKLLLEYAAWDEDRWKEKCDSIEEWSSDWFPVEVDL